MASDFLNVDPHADDPLTAGERQRIGDLLASVSTRTLLQSLVGLCRMSEDAKLIIAELVDRSPSEAPARDDAVR